MGKDKVLKKLLKTTGYPLKACLYVGDENRDIEACMKINMDCMANWGCEDEPNHNYIIQKGISKRCRTYWHS
jgi:phosphoglycolate phosphatase-like HAD superfamily hydrolase